MFEYVVGGADGNHVNIFIQISCMYKQLCTNSFLGDVLVLLYRHTDPRSPPVLVLAIFPAPACVLYRKLEEGSRRLSSGRFHLIAASHTRYSCSACRNPSSSRVCHVD